MIDRIERRAGALAGSVADLLQLARGRAELSTSELERIDFCALLAENLAYYQPQADEKSLRLTVSCPREEAEVYGRRQGLQSIIANLLSNAIKYTPAGGRIEVAVRRADEQHLLMEVRDTGIGIPREEQEKLFGEFFRAANARRLGETGTGLGLAIVKSTVEQHGGRIEVESAEGKGSVFRVFLQPRGQIAGGYSSLAVGKCSTTTHPAAPKPISSSLSHQASTRNSTEAPTMPAMAATEMIFADRGIDLRS